MSKGKHVIELRGLLVYLLKKFGIQVLREELDKLDAERDWR